MGLRVDQYLVLKIRGHGVETVAGVDAGGALLRELAGFASPLVLPQFHLPEHPQLDIGASQGEYVVHLLTDVVVHLTLQEGKEI